MILRPEHASSGDPCDRCGVRASGHRAKRRKRKTDRPRKPRPKASDRVIGIDGEGVGRRPHLYTYLCAADATGEKWDVRAPDGGRLDTAACLDLILSLPRRALVIGFSFPYDLTKILTDLPDTVLCSLFNEQSRVRVIANRIVYRPVRWRGYKLNYMNKRFTVRKGKVCRSVWDFFKFFQCSFVRALEDWKVGTALERADVAAMKAQRSVFQDSDEVRAYCQTECRLLAKLGRVLLDAHVEANLELKTYNGPGSSASVLLKRLGIGEIRGEQPAAMRHAIAAAFFGGRFEHSIIGPAAGQIWGYDLASAYPYACTDLPCLMHGRWRLVKAPKLHTISQADIALVHWTGGGPLPGTMRKDMNAWGALPVRASNGSILFPLGGDGGWAWGDEYQAAVYLGFDFRAREAWLYTRDCDCPSPFASLSTIYRERVRLGKDGPGRVLKLALNSASYGKLAQSRGLRPPFQSWVWAGMVTSKTRAELLRAIGQAHDRWNVLMLATDGLYSRERLNLRKPRDTGTGDLAKPLGCWEEKSIDGGVFAVRPGIYFPLDPSDETEVKARGLGKRTLVEKRDVIIRAFEAGSDTVKVGDMQRFCGAKSSLHPHKDGTVNRSADYGEWVPHEIELKFTPHPKRRAQETSGRLTTFDWAGWESFPYTDAESSPEAELLKLLEQRLEEQPDGDFQ